MTIKDLAQTTGYGVATISRVLNGQPNVSEKTRAAILQAVEESGFQINTNARQLKQQNATCILVVVKGTGNEMFCRMVEYLQARAAQTSYPLTVDYLDEDADEVQRAEQLCRERKPRGILFLGGNRKNFLNHFHKIPIPCVLISNDGSDLPFANLSSVTTDDRLASRHAVNMLVELGHRQIAMVGGDRTGSDIGRLRYEGCLDAVKAHGLPFDRELDYQQARFSFREGYQATEKLLSRDRGFTALFAASDVMAIGAIRALRDHGLRVPEDVSVVGFDGLELGSYLIPQLSTVTQSVRQMADRGMEILLEAMEQERPARHETIPFTLCRRQSVTEK